MSLFAILLFVGTMVLSLWATVRVRQVYAKFSQLPASSGLTGAATAATILRQEGIYNASKPVTSEFGQIPPPSGECLERQ
jgi:uncharacterized protein